MNSSYYMRLCFKSLVSRAVVLISIFLSFSVNAQILIPIKVLDGGQERFVFIPLETHTNEEPVITITEPMDGDTFIVGPNIDLIATATDAEDGDLSANIEWSSSVDGVLGTGASLSVNLSIGTHTIKASVTDSDNAMTEETISINVQVNNAPVAVDDIVVTEEDQVVIINVLDNDTDADGNVLTITFVAEATYGTVVNNSTDVTYTPNSGYVGQDSFTYTISDGFGGTSSATVTVTMTSNNQSPVANNDDESTLKNQPVTIQVLANDTDVDADVLSISSITQGTNGAVVNNSTNVTYTPNNGYVGGDSFTYTIDDGQGGTSTATVTVNVFEIGQSYNRVIDVPAGVGGLQPNLVLSYEKGRGNSFVGLDWKLDGLPRVERCEANLAEDGFVSGINFDANDRFCLDGEKLILASGNYGSDGATYTLASATYTNITSYDTDPNNQGPEYFTALSTSGNVYKFGDTTDSSIKFDGSNDVAFWALASVSDSLTNSYTITYDGNGPSAGSYKPISINYLDQTLASIQISFEYEARQDVTVQWYGGNQVVFNQRLTAIKIYSNTTLIKDIDFDYLNQGSANSSLLSGLTECDGIGNCLPQVTYQWTSLANEVLFEHWTSISPPITGQNVTHDHYFADINADGRDDIIIIAKGADAAEIGLSNGSEFVNFITTSMIGSASTHRHFFTDLNADSMADLVQISNISNEVKVAFADGSGNFNYWTHQFTQVGNASIHTHFLQDVNGDGIADLIQIAKNAAETKVAFSNGDGTFDFWTHTTTQFSPDSGHAHYFADINGDGLKDIVEFYRTLNDTDHGPIKAALSTGDGSFIDVPVSANPVVGAHVLFADVNGDQAADLIMQPQVTQSQHVRVGLAKGDGTFKYWSYSENNIGASTQNFKYYMFDVNGNGMADWARYDKRWGAGTNIYLANGRGTLTGPAFHQSHIAFHLIPYLADVNGDGKEDFVMINQDGPAQQPIYVSLNRSAMVCLINDQ